LARWLSEFDQERDRDRLYKAQAFANIGTWEWNLETNEMIWTEIIPVLFGYPEGGLETSYANFMAAVHPDDTVRWLLETGAIVRSGDGTAKQMLSVVEDVTQVHEAEQQLANQASLLNMLQESLTLH
jgi:hypothetical protein